MTTPTPAQVLNALRELHAAGVDHMHIAPSEGAKWYKSNADMYAALSKASAALAAFEQATSLPQPPAAGQHTPGPWQVWTYGAEDVRNVAVGPVAGGLAVADVVQCNAHGIHTAETEARGMANAALIAKAPEMHAALVEIHKFWCCPEPKTLKDWSARCDVMAAEARRLLS